MNQLSLHLLHTVLGLYIANVTSLLVLQVTHYSTLNKSSPNLNYNTRFRLRPESKQMQAETQKQLSKHRKTVKP
jgi:hypothetical protein